jgi:hypothetical protein
MLARIPVRLVRIALFALPPPLGRESGQAGTPCELGIQRRALRLREKPDERFFPAAAANRPLGKPDGMRLSWSFGGQPHHQLATIALILLGFLPELAHFLETHSRNHSFSLSRHGIWGHLVGHGSSPEDVRG